MIEDGFHKEQDWYFRDNGFIDLRSMNQSHQPIIQATLDIVGNEHWRVLDLGCGNGALVKSIRHIKPKITPAGVDIDSMRISHSHLLLPEFASNFLVGNIITKKEIWTTGEKRILALLMPGRLLEVGSSDAARFKEKLDQYCEKIIIYAYDDLLAQWGTLENFCQRVGFEITLSADNKIGLVTAIH